MLAIVLTALLSAFCLRTSSGYLEPHQEPWVIDAFVDQLLKDIPKLHEEALNFLKLSDDKVSFSYKALFIDVHGEAAITDMTLKGYDDPRRFASSEVTTEADGTYYVTAHLSHKGLTFDGNAHVTFMGEGPHVQLQGSIDELRLEVDFYPNDLRGDVIAVRVKEMIGFKVDVREGGVIGLLAKGALEAFKTSLEKSLKSSLEKDLTGLYKITFS